ncbi:MAG: DNA primase [Cyanobacteriota bacterium]
MNRPATAPHQKSNHRPNHLPKQVVEAVREKASILEFFPRSSLRRSGKEYLTRCPWHDDHSPSLTINPQRNRVHCYVCDRGADAIGWLQDRQGLTFAEAVQELAGRYGIPLPEEDPQAAAQAEALRKDRQRLLSWRQKQQEAFHQALLGDIAAEGPACAYLQERGITPDTANAWELGLNARRVMLPICDSQGRCCGFSGRTLANEEPKYRNSAGDALFCKNKLLFGLPHAADAIRRSGEALLVEGPLDVIQLHQARFPNAVAVMGTSLSAEQLQSLIRAGARRLLVAYDGDPAGRKATERLIAELHPHLIAGGLDLAVVSLPTGSDPDGLIRKEGPEALQLRLDSATHWLSWELDQLLAPLVANPDDLSAVQRCERQAKELLALLPSGALRQRAEQRLQEGLGVVPKVVCSKAKAAQRESGLLAKGAQPWPPCVSDHVTAEALDGASAIERAELRALRLFLCSPACRDPLAVLVIHNELYRRAQACLVEAHRRLTGPIRSAQEDPLPRAVMALGPRLEPRLAAFLESICTMNSHSRKALFLKPEGEMMSILDVLEPVR